MNYTTAKSLMDYLERQLGDRAKIIRANRDFTDQITDISRIQSRISNLRLMNSEGGEDNVESQLELAKAERMLQDRTARVRELTRDIEAGTYSTETGVKANDMISRWLEQVLLLEKTKAEMSAQDIMRQKLDRQILYYAPIGATLDRKGRHIGFIEGNYMERQTSCAESADVPHECSAHQQTDDSFRSLPVGIHHDSTLFLHHRVARSHPARPYALRANHQAASNGLLPQGEYIALPPFQQDDC